MRLQLLRLHAEDLHAHLRRKFQNLKAMKKNAKCGCSPALRSNSDRNDFNDF